MWRATFLRPFLLCVCLVAVLESGCSRRPTGPPLYPVRGKVLYRGKPAAGAWVVLHPVGGSQPRSQTSQGEVGTDGSFGLTTRVAGDGAPTGEYAVTINWPRPRPANAPPDDPSPGDWFQNRYNDPGSPAWKVQVRAEPNELPTFELR